MGWVGGNFWKNWCRTSTLFDINHCNKIDWALCVPFFISIHFKWVAESFGCRLEPNVSKMRKVPKFYYLFVWNCSCKPENFICQYLPLYWWYGAARPYQSLGFPTLFFLIPYVYDKPLQNRTWRFMKTFKEVGAEIGIFSRSYSLQLNFSVLWSLPPFKCFPVAVGFHFGPYKTQRSCSVQL